MDVNTLLQDNKNKLIFLKAVLLGINYGKSKDANNYYENIQNEINRLTNIQDNSIQAHNNNNINNYNVNKDSNDINDIVVNNNLCVVVKIK